MWVYDSSIRKEGHLTNISGCGHFGGWSLKSKTASLEPFKGCFCGVYWTWMCLGKQ